VSPEWSADDIGTALSDEALSATVMPVAMCSAREHSRQI
jgi:hypothetical protein